MADEVFKLNDKVRVPILENEVGTITAITYSVKFPRAVKPKGRKRGNVSWKVSHKAVQVVDAVDEATLQEAEAAAEDAVTVALLEATE